jgi:arginine decarboxylase
MLNQTQTPILAILKASGARDHAPFYAPGHKRGRGASPQLQNLLGLQALRVDLPELPELDNLFAPEGVIQEAQTLAAEAFGAEQTYFLANGSTCGIEAAILATCGPGDKIIVPRNAHRSVIAGLVLAGAMPVFVEPQYAPELGLVLGISADAIASALHRHPDTRAVLVVSPTYHGICSDIAAIAHLAHAHHLPLLVDEAHGAHFGFHPHLPSTALGQGADLVVQSTHKLLGALTQASMLHTQGHRINRSRLQAALQLTQSTSPSYLLLASLDAARHQMATGGPDLLTQTLALAGQMRSGLKALPSLKVIAQEDVLPLTSVKALDPTRLTVDVAGLGLTGLEADEILHEELGVTAELPELRHLTFIVSIGNTLADGERCLEGFKILQSRCADGGEKHHAFLLATVTPPRPAVSQPLVAPRAAFFAEVAVLPAQAAVGRLSAETISPYPPGIPVIVAGERITGEALASLNAVKRQGGYITGCSDLSLNTIKVLNLG